MLSSKSSPLTHDQLEEQIKDTSLNRLQKEWNTLESLLNSLSSSLCFQSNRSIAFLTLSIHGLLKGLDVALNSIRVYSSLLSSILTFNIHLLGTKRIRKETDALLVQKRNVHEGEVTNVPEVPILSTQLCQRRKIYSLTTPFSSLFIESMFLY